MRKYARKRFHNGPSFHVGKEGPFGPSKDVVVDISFGCRELNIYDFDVLGWKWDQGVIRDLITSGLGRQAPLWRTQCRVYGVLECKYLEQGYLKVTFLL